MDEEQDVRSVSPVVDIRYDPWKLRRTGSDQCGRMWSRRAKTDLTGKEAGRGDVRGDRGDRRRSTGEQKD